MYLFVMKLKRVMRLGYENYKLDLLKAFDFLSSFKYEVVDQRSDGSFFAYGVILTGSKVKTIRIYHEFIEQQLIVTLQIGNEYYTTLEINRKINAINEGDLNPKGDDYLDALMMNALIVRKVIEENR